MDYKKLRTTLVLIAHSRAMTQVDVDVRRPFMEALSAAIAANYDFEVLPFETTELLYAVVDDTLAADALAEYEFIPQIGSVRVHNMACGSCALCGKGDSKGDGTNRDQLLIEYLLTNTAGGESLWVGSTCILNHALKVSGAETSEEARMVLARAMRAAVSAHEAEMWRMANPDHTSIPDVMYRLEEQARQWSFFYERYRLELEAFGCGWAYGRRVIVPQYRTMRKVVSHYRRKNTLTPSKHEWWKSSEALLVRLEEIQQLLRSLSANTEEARLDAVSAYIARTGGTHGSRTHTA